MRHLFDTSVAIAFRDGDLAVLDRAGPMRPVVLLSAVSVVELEGGVARAGTGRAQRRDALDAMYDTLDILPFGMREAAFYGQIVNDLGFARGLIIDRMIAAQALAADAILVTFNARDFRGISGLRLEDWSEPA